MPESPKPAHPLAAELTAAVLEGARLADECRAARRPYAAECAGERVVTREMARAGMAHEYLCVMLARPGDLPCPDEATRLAVHYADALLDLVEREDAPTPAPTQPAQPPEAT